jgi:hypothetical protein
MSSGFSVLYVPREIEPTTERGVGLCRKYNLQYVNKYIKWYTVFSDLVLAKI